MEGATPDLVHAKTPRYCADTASMGLSFVLVQWLIAIDEIGNEANVSADRFSIKQFNAVLCAVGNQTGSASIKVDPANRLVPIRRADSSVAINGSQWL